MWIHIYLRELAQRFELGLAHPIRPSLFVLSWYAPVSVAPFVPPARARFHCANLVLVLGDHRFVWMLDPRAIPWLIVIIFALDCMFQWLTHTIVKPSVCRQTHVLGAWHPPRASGCYFAHVEFPFSWRPLALLVGRSSQVITMHLVVCPLLPYTPVATQVSRATSRDVLPRLFPELNLLKRLLASCARRPGGVFPKYCVDPRFLGCPLEHPRHLRVEFHKASSESRFLGDAPLPHQSLPPKGCLHSRVLRGPQKQTKTKQSTARQSKAKQTTETQSKAKQSDAKQRNANQSEAKQSKAKESKAKQRNAAQREAKLSKAKHSKAKQSKAR